MINQKQDVSEGHQWNVYVLCGEMLSSTLLFFMETVDSVVTFCAYIITLPVNILVVLIFL